MATDSQLTATLASIAVLGPKAADIVALCDRAVADLLASGRPYQSYNQGGREVRFDLQNALAIRRYYQDQARIDKSNGGMSVSFSEF